MARRAGEKCLVLTPNTRSVFRNKHRGSHRDFKSFLWSFVLIWSALSCGYCGADTEFSILEEAQVLAEQMKKLSSQELGVFTMQVKAEDKCSFYYGCSCFLICCLSSGCQFHRVFALYICGFKDPGCHNKSDAQNTRQQCLEITYTNFVDGQITMLPNNAHFGCQCCPALCDCGY